MMAIQLGQWAAFLAAMYRIHIGKVNGWSLASDALGSIFLTLLALGVMSGLGPRTWKLCVVGAFLATAAPFIAWFEEAALFIFLIDRAWIGDVVGRGPVAAPG